MFVSASCRFCVNCSSVKGHVLQQRRTDDDGEHSMRTRGCLIHVRGRDCPGLPSAPNHHRGKAPKPTLFPSSIRVIICRSFSTTSRLRSSTYGPKDGCSLTRRLPLFFGFKRSRTLLVSSGRLYMVTTPTFRYISRCTIPRRYMRAWGPVRNALPRDERAQMSSGVLCPCRHRLPSALTA